jgi:hypothetical protein
VSVYAETFSITDRAKMTESLSWKKTNPYFSCNFLLPKRNLQKVEKEKKCLEIKDQLL